MNEQKYLNSKTALALGLTLIAAGLETCSPPRSAAMPCNLAVKCASPEHADPGLACPEPPGGPGGRLGSSSGYSAGDDPANYPVGQPGSSGGGGCSSCGGPPSTGVIVWGAPNHWVSEPWINIRIEDQPLGYTPGRGPAVAFRLSYRQRGSTTEVPSIFGVGTNWSCSFRAYLTDLGNNAIAVHRGGEGVVQYSLGATQFRDGSIVNSVTGGYEIEYRDGSKDTFTTSFTMDDGTVLYFLTTRKDAPGNALTFNYLKTSAFIQITNVTDSDGRSTALYYEDPVWTNQITKVVDPFNRTNLIKYDGSSGYLTGIVDVAGISSSFIYYSDAGARAGWITNMISPYGTTSFRCGGDYADGEDIYIDGTNVSRFVEVTLPNSGKELYLFQGDCSAFLSTSNWPTPVTTPFANTFSYDEDTQHRYNSFYWSPLQHAHLSTSDPMSLSAADYRLARLRHWLGLPVNGAPVTTALSIERAASQDGSSEGQVVHYDYDNRYGIGMQGTNNFPSLMAMILPDGGTRFTHYARGAHSQVTEEVSTYTKTDGTVGLRTNTFVYGANSVDLAQWIGPNGEQVVSNYFNAHHQPLASYDALSQETLHTYNANLQLASTTKPTGLAVTNRYFPNGAYQGWLSSTTEYNGSDTYRTNGYTYADGLVQTGTDERGLQVTYCWDRLRRLIGAVYPDGSSTSNRYTVLDLTGSKDRLGYWSYFGYNAVRQIVAETNANGVVTLYSYCECGALYSITRAWNTPVEQVTSFAYDYQGNRLYITNADGMVVTNWFDPLGRIYITSDGTGYKWFYYNNQGLLTTVSNVCGLERVTVFDSEDRPLWVTDANGVTVTNSYDDLGRLRVRTYPDGGFESFGYSARGLVAYTNQIGLSNFFAYDAAGRKIFETNANWDLIRFTNSPAGDLLSLSDGRGYTTRWNYDEYGRVTNKLDQLGTEILRYKYDADSRLTNRWSAAKTNTYYAYDPVGNLTNIDYAVSPDVSLAYDALNRLTTMVDGVGTTVYGYTAGDQLWTEDGPWASDTVTNGYQNRLRVALALQQPSLLWTNGFAYDLARRLTNVVSAAGSFTNEYPGGVGGASGFSSALVKKLLLPNGAYITNSFDGKARLSETSLRNSIDTVLDSYAYLYDPANERTNLTRADASTVTYKYDPIGQLKAADSSLAGEDRGYRYDASWNMLNRTSGVSVTTYTYNEMNELYAVGVDRLAYDANGNLVTNYAARLRYSYDDENRLIQLVYVPPGGPLIPTPNGGWKSTFDYDGLGRMRVRKDYYAYDTGYYLTNTTRYIYDGMRQIQERNASNAPTVSYTRGNDLSGSLEGAGGIGGLLARSAGYSAGNWTNHAYYFADGNGNITYMLDGDQSVVASYRYDPFGNTISKSGSLADANLYRFSSKPVHAYSGLYYYLYRFYDPNLQRWINRDPIGELGGFNLYLFTINDPLNWLDTAGLGYLPICSMLGTNYGYDPGLRGGGNVFGIKTVNAPVRKAEPGSPGKTNPPPIIVPTNPPQTNPPSSPARRNPPGRPRGE